MTSNDTLKLIFERQLQLQKESFGTDPQNLSGGDLMEYIRSMTLAAEDELHEALNEVGWKPWQSSKHVNADAVGAELVDALHFLVNLWLAVGWTDVDVAEYYFKKANRNADRQKNGYDGISGKCMQCRRDFSDPGVHCSPELGCVL